MIKFLSISSVVPFDGISHAGGKTYNTYLKRLALEDGINIEVLAFSRKCELDKRDYKEYGIIDHTIISSGSISTNIIHGILDTWGKLTRYGKFYSFFKKQKILYELKKMNRNNELPDIIELEWTDMVLLAKDIRMLFPHIIILGSEHDVTFLGAYRRYLNEKGQNKALYKKYVLIKKMELDAISSCNIVMPHNKKDEELLISNGVSKSKVFTIVPYYHNMTNVKRININNDILFWGAMGRSENVEACQWFIDKVMPLLENINIRFVIAGNNPPDELITQQNNKIIVTGFVKDETSLFENSMCFVCPLINGAGIKVKILEAMSSGIPVLTNEIGIEGIPAKQGESYIHCSSPEEYAKAIVCFYNDRNYIKTIGDSGKKMVNQYFNINESIDNYVTMIHGLCEEK